MTIPDADAPAVTGQLKDLTSLGLGTLPGYTDPALAEMLDRVVSRLDRPGASISGYNGAGFAENVSPAFGPVAAPAEASDGRLHETVELPDQES